MAVNCVLTRSVIHDGWLSPARTPVVVLAVTREGKVSCRSTVSVGPEGEVSQSRVIEVLPEEIRFGSLTPN